MIVQVTYIIQSYESSALPVDLNTKAKIDTNIKNSIYFNTDYALSKFIFEEDIIKIADELAKKLSETKLSSTRNIILIQSGYGRIKIKILAKLNLN